MTPDGAGRVGAADAALSPGSDTADLAREMAGLRAEVAALVALVRRPEAARLLSLRAAAGRLGVSRTRTLPALIRDRRLRIVHINGRPKVPLSEVERIEREGTARIGLGKHERPAPGKSRAPLARDLV